MWQTKFSVIQVFGSKLPSLDGRGWGRVLAFAAILVKPG